MATREKLKAEQRKQARAEKGPSASPWIEHVATEDSIGYRSDPRSRR